MEHNSALLDEGTIETTENERYCREPDVADREPVVAVMYVDTFASFLFLVAQL